jgi:hypothetical protein
MNIHLEERRVGDLVVREPTLGQVMEMREKYSGGDALTLAMLGACVSNGTGVPIGIEGARNLPARLAARLSMVVADLTGDSDAPEGEAQKNG